MAVIQHVRDGIEVDGKWCFMGPCKSFSEIKDDAELTWGQLYQTLVLPVKGKGFYINDGVDENTGELFIEVPEGAFFVIVK